ncbi:proline--tRNA ligase [Candidatus Ishikawella capsulata]|nr:proline--tRNA ligase [Candidatus Ishikawaella capsulata]
MRTTKYLLSTQKEMPSGTDIISHQLMLRAGMIRKLASGIYTFLPTGLRVLKKIESIIREEMNNICAMEITMPFIQPAELWQKSGRWDNYGPELFRIVDRHDCHHVLAPTHEEVISMLIQREISSYKQLPLILYQIQTKFRDEIRPRFGIMRSREFVMKDAYSFHSSQECLKKTYEIMYRTYSKIFKRMGLIFKTVAAGTGIIGGNVSHEFQVIANNGENHITFSTESDYAANLELAEAVTLICKRSPPKQDMIQIDTPKTKTILSLVKIYGVSIEKIVKTVIVKASQESGYKLVALLLRGDHELNTRKAEKIDMVKSPLTFASEKEINDWIGCTTGSLGPINLPFPIIADRTVVNMSDFIAGANIDGKHYMGINWERDLQLPFVADLRKVAEGDPSPDGKGILKIVRGIEVGHIFQLGTKYSSVMKTSIQGEDGSNHIVNMGCYGIGITRVIAAAIEQNHDNKGIIWPIQLAPFEVAILPINMYKSLLVNKVTEKIYRLLIAKGIDVILDDRQERLGVMLADMELIGIPYIVIIGDRKLKHQELEYKIRNFPQIQTIKESEIVPFLLKACDK